MKREKLPSSNSLPKLKVSPWPRYWWSCTRCWLLQPRMVFTGYRIYMSFLQTVPPVLVCALGLTLVITAGEIDLSFPGGGGALRVCLRLGLQELSMSPWAPWAGFILALAVRRTGRVCQRLAGRQGRRAFDHGHPGGAILLVRGHGSAGQRAPIEHQRGHDQSRSYDLCRAHLRESCHCQAIWALGLAVFLWFILNRHKFGEEIMFIGDNANVARVMGIDVVATRIKLFTVMGVIAAFAGLLLTLEINVFFPTQGAGFLLPAMAAVFIGGTSIAGGLGSMFGTFFGAYIIGSLEAGMSRPPSAAIGFSWWKALSWAPLSCSTS